MKRSYMAAAILAAALSGCRREAQRVPEVVAAETAKPPSDPADAAWDSAPEHLAKLIPQDLVEPRQLNPTTAEVKVRALSNGSDVAFRLEWADAEKSDALGPGSMVDACAIQIPEKIEKDLPEPQMGQEGKLVQVTYWRADWQASMDGRGDTIRDLYPNATVDHYPFEAQSLQKGSDVQKEMASRYAPARALGNLRSGPRSTPVEELVATGPGTLSPGSGQGANGKGAYGKQGWTVVIGRKLPAGLAAGVRTHIAFAVWQGSQKETGARKMRTGWIPLLRKGRP